MRSDAVEGVRTLEPDLLGDRHQQLEWAMLERLVFDERHHRRDCDPVVSAQGRTVGSQPVIVADDDDSSFGRIIRARRVALADHVKVALEDEDGRRLTARSRGNAYDEVAAGVLLELVTAVAGPSSYVLDHGLLLARRTRDLRQRSEVTPERAGLQSVKYRCRCRHAVSDETLQRCSTSQAPKCIDPVSGPNRVSALGCRRPSATSARHVQVPGRLRARARTDRRAVRPARAPRASRSVAASDPR